MTDIALTWNAAIGCYDISMAGFDLATDDGLDTAITISLFTDALADQDDALPGTPQDTDRRGTWMDAFPLDPAIAPNSDPMGSKLWLLTATELTTETLVRAEDYALDGMAWMIEDGVADKVDAQATATGISAMNLAIAVTQGGASKVYDKQWAASA